LRPRIALHVGALALVLAVQALPASATHGGDTLVSKGSPPGPFSQNKQNEPAIAVDQNHPNILAAGSNDNIDMELCNAGTDDTCPFTDGVGGSGVYFSFDSGDTWTQPTYSGLSGRGCVGAPGDADPPCEPVVGPIGTVPNYYENGLVSDGDPALAFGPAPGPGGFSWANGSRLYYANLASKIDPNAFSGFEAIAVSHTDDVAAAAADVQDAWSDPVIASKQNAALFSDKEQVWADNAASSPFFGNAYVCYAGFRSLPGVSQPLFALTSRNGGRTWSQHQLTPATNNTHSPNGFGRSGCTVRTDSDGVVYVFDYQFAFATDTAGQGKIQMIKSFDGGAHWTRPRNLFTVGDTCNAFEPSIGRCVMDGVGGARSDLSPDPSVDIANGAPTGADATDQIVMSYVDGTPGLNNEKVMFTTSTNHGGTWTSPRDITTAGDRGYYTAPAISPEGRDAYVVYNAFTTPFRNSAEGPTNDRQLVGVVLHADVGGGTVGAFSSLHRGSSGDARSSSQNNLAAEFLGDYVYAVATRDYGAAVWNDVRNGTDCPAIDEYRQELHEEAVATGRRTADAEEPRGAEAREQRGKKAQEEEPEAPAVQAECPVTFGNSDIYGGSYADPTP